MSVSQLDAQFQKNGAVIGLKLNGSIVHAVNNLDNILTSKVAKEDLDATKQELSDKMNTKMDLSSFYDYMEPVNNQLSSLNTQINNIPALKPCKDFTLSDPPTDEELSLLNAMEVGDFYTLNGGSAVLIFRGELTK